MKHSPSWPILLVPCSFFWVCTRGTQLAAPNYEGGILQLMLKSFQNNARSTKTCPSDQHEASDVCGYATLALASTVRCQVIEPAGYVPFRPTVLHMGFVFGLQSLRDSSGPVGQFPICAQTFMSLGVLCLSADWWPPSHDLRVGPQKEEQTCLCSFLLYS